MATKIFFRLFGVFLFIFSSLTDIKAVTYYAREAGPLLWGNTASWSTVSPTGPSCGCIPLATDNVIINAVNFPISMTVDGAYSITNVTIGDGSGTDNNDATLVISGTNSLTITGALAINVGNQGRAYTLDAAAGTINVNGTFPVWGTGGANNIQVSTGTITFVPLVNLSSAKQYITFTGAGTINFNAGFTCNQSQASFITVAGCTVNITGAYTQPAANITWFLTSNAVFKGIGSTINNTSRVNFGNVIIYNSASVSTAGAGNLNIYSNLTLNASSTFNITKNIPANISVGNSIDDVTLNSGSTLNLGGAGTYIQIQGNWLNNGGTLNGGTYTVRFEGLGNSIGGTSSTTFPDVQIGNILNNVNYTLNQNITCANLIFDADNSSRTLTHSGANALTVTGNVTINQPTGNFTNLWDIAAGSATVTGDLIYLGSNNTATRVCKVNVSSGALTLNGNVTWMTGQGAPAEVATEVISVGTGTITLTNSLTMGQGSGTFNVNGAGTVNFNGTIAPSYYLNQTVAGNTINAVFTTSLSSVINFFNGFTNDNIAVTLANGSTAVFTGTGIITPAFPITFGNVQINAAPTVILAGNISVQNNWTNLGGTFVPATFGVTFNGTAAQTITKAAGETFYNLTTNTTGPLTLASNVNVTNALTMLAGNYNLNTYTLTLGVGSGASLTRTAGFMYGGTLKRWFPTVAISSTASPLYGLFPMGNTTDYRPVEINSTANPTTAGYVLCVHTDALSVTDVSYTDNEAVAIERRTNQKSTLSISGLAGGTYNLDVSMTTLGNAGVLSDLKMETIAGPPYGVGVTAATTGLLSAPTVKRTGLTPADLVNDFVVATKNKTVTPIRQFYYSIASGSWATLGTWSLKDPALGPAPSCTCIPSPDGYAIITNFGTPVSVNAPAIIDLVDIRTGLSAPTLNGTSNLTVNYDLTTDGTGKFSPTTGTWTVSRNVTLNGTGASNTASGTMSINGDLTLSGTSLQISAGGLIVAGNLVDNGTVDVVANLFRLSGAGKTISGTGTIIGTGNLQVTTSKTILAGTTLTITPTFAISAATITNNGTIILQNNMTGISASSIWTNNPGSTLNITGNLLVTGTLNASAVPNTVNYNGSGAQTVKSPSASTYYNLIASNAGTKTTTGTITVSNLLTVQDAAIFDAGANTLNGSGGLTMTGTTPELRIGYSVGAPGVPELSGTYNLTAGTIVFNNGGNQNIRSLNSIPAAYYNVDFSNSGVKNLTGPITVQKNLTISGTARLDVTGNNYAINLYGNWSSTSTNPNPFNERNGTVTLSGAAQQTITTVLAGGETFYNLTVNNSTPAQAISLSSPVTVSNNLNLTDGHIITSAVNLLTMDVNASLVQAFPPDSSFVKGPMAYIVNSFISETKVFPVGKANDYRRLDLTVTRGAAAPATTTYTAEMLNSSAQVFGYTLPGTINRVSDARYHTVTASDATPAAAAQVRMYFQCTQRTDNVTDLPNLKIAQWDGGTAWIDRNPTTAPAAGGLCNGTDYSGQILSESFTTFTGNKFSVANKTGGSNPLPVTLLYFDAEPNGNTVETNWSTASEINSDYFIVQRSKEGTVFEDAVRKEASGNSSTTKNYSAVDHEPYTGISYYRLKQADKDGKFTYGNIVSVNIEGEKGIAVYPNPTSGPFNVSINGEHGDQVLVVVRDVLGKEFYSKIIILSNAQEVLAIDPSGKIAAGVYFVIASSNNKIYEKKIVISRR